MCCIIIVIINDFVLFLLYWCSHISIPGVFFFAHHLQFGYPRNFSCISNCRFFAWKFIPFLGCYKKMMAMTISAAFKNTLLPFFTQHFTIISELGSIPFCLYFLSVSVYLTNSSLRKNVNHSWVSFGKLLKGRHVKKKDGWQEQNFSFRK